MPRTRSSPLAGRGLRLVASKPLHSLALVVVVVCGLFVRCLPLLLTGGVEQTGDFDEGVYLSAAGLFSEGRVPYKEFVLLHPPGLLLVTWPLTVLAPDVLGWSDVVVAVRWLSALAGVANILLLVVVVGRWRGPTAGLIAGALYATYRPAIYVEGHLVLEPYVVLLVLLGACVWLSPGSGTTRRWAAGAGVLLASAGLVKLTGGLALLALLLSPTSSGHRRRAALWSIAGACVVTAVVLTPFALAAGPSRLWDQLVLAQAKRPGGDVSGGSIMGLSGRLLQMGRFGVLGAEAVPDLMVWLLLMVLATAACWAVFSGGRDGRFWVVALTVLLGPPLFAPDWYTQYSVPGAAAISALLGAFIAVLTASLRNRTSIGASAAGAAAAIVVLLSLTDVTRDAWLERPRSAAGFGSRAQAAVAAEDCLVADPPGLALMADRLPPRDRSGSFLVDPFGALLLESLEHEVPGTTGDLLTAPVAQARLKDALSSCPYVALGGNPARNPHMSAETEHWFQRRFLPVPSASTSSGVLWQARGEG